MTELPSTKTGAMRTAVHKLAGRRDTVEYVLTLASINELFVAPEPDPWSDRVRTESGIDELVAELVSRPLPKEVRLVVRLPAGGDGGHSPTEVRAAIARAAEERSVRNGRAVRSLRHEGWHSLYVGLGLFIVGLYLSVSFLDRNVPEVLREVFGNGVFLVVAWVGLWYPLDTLLFGRRPLVKEQRALELLRGIEVELVAGVVPTAAHEDGYPSAPAMDLGSPPAGDRHLGQHGPGPQ